VAAIDGFRAIVPSYAFRAVEAFRCTTKKDIASNPNPSKNSNRSRSSILCNVRGILPYRRLDLKANEEFPKKSLAFFSP